LQQQNGNRVAAIPVRAPDEGGGSAGTKASASGGEGGVSRRKPGSHAQ
jgi:hypothetical protein